MNRIKGICLAAFLIIGGRSIASDKVTISTLLDEMISFEKAAEFPDPYYTCKMISSYDRRTVSPDKDWWYANDDGFGCMRLDTIQGRVEKVMFDYEGPGVVTRIWLTTNVKNGTLRFYFDGEENPRLVIPAYDMTRAPFRVGDALSLIHTNYTPEGAGGNTFMFPLPYQKSCRITFEEPNKDRNTWSPRYHEIEYRTYAPGTEVETFHPGQVHSHIMQEKIQDVNKALWNPQTFKGGERREFAMDIAPNQKSSLELPAGSHAVRSLIIDVHCRKGDYAKMMRQLILKISFDGKETVWAPLGDFSGAGLGAPKVDSWYMDADGRGHITSRWVMPYKENAKIEVENLFEFPVWMNVRAYVSDWKWNKNTLYFHTTWKQERGIELSNRYDDHKGDHMWNYITINGRGVFKGDLLSLFNYAPDWYGEGDEKIWVDNDVFPSHHGTGTEDHYNCSWAPVVPFHTPYGGAPRADNPSSHGFNAFVRTRNLDGIPFQKLYRFDIEMLSWNPGKVDYAVTNYWYGDLDAKINESSGKEEVVSPLPYLM